VSSREHFAPLVTKIAQLKIDYQRTLESKFQYNNIGAVIVYTSADVRDKETGEIIEMKGHGTLLEKKRELLDTEAYMEIEITKMMYARMEPASDNYFRDLIGLLVNPEIGEMERLLAEFRLTDAQDKV
jgi:hypothetical protein